MAKEIEIGPKKTYYKGVVLYVEFSDRTYEFIPDTPIENKANRQEAASCLVAGIMMLSYTDQVEYKMSEFGYPGKIHIIKQ